MFMKYNEPNRLSAACMVARRCLASFCHTHAQGRVLEVVQEWYLAVQLTRRFSFTLCRFSVGLQQQARVGLEYRKAGLSIVSALLLLCLLVAVLCAVRFSYGVQPRFESAPGSTTRI